MLEGSLEHGRFSGVDNGIRRLQLFLIFHHAKEIGLFALGQEVRKVALVGFEDSAIPVLVDKDPLLASKENFKVPKCEIFKAMKLEDEVFAKMTAGARGVEKLRIRNLIIIPPWIMEMIIRGETGSFAEAFMVILGAARSKDIIDSVDLEENQILSTS
eukprot:11838216-Ditylum_brightwellii.AAC.1